MYPNNSNENSNWQWIILIIINLCCSIAGILFTFAIFMMAESTGNFIIISIAVLFSDIFFPIITLAIIKGKTWPLQVFKILSYLLFFVPIYCLYMSYYHAAYLVWNPSKSISEMIMADINFDSILACLIFPIIIFFLIRYLCQKSYIYISNSLDDFNFLFFLKSVIKSWKQILIIFITLIIIFEILNIIIIQRNRYIYNISVYLKIDSLCILSHDSERCNMNFITKVDDKWKECLNSSIEQFQSYCLKKAAFYHQDFNICQLIPNNSFGDKYECYNKFNKEMYKVDYDFCKKLENNPSDVKFYSNFNHQRDKCIILYINQNPNKTNCDKEFKKGDYNHYECLDGISKYKFINLN